MMRKLFSISIVMLFVCLVFKASAQQEEFTLHGVVSKKLSGERVAQVIILNQRTHNIIMSDNLGWFTVKAAIGDTLLFSKFEYTDQKIVITGKNDLPVYMQPVIKLAEVKIAGETKKQELNDVMKQYRSQGTFYDGKPPVLSFLSSPITGLYELFGTTPNRAKHFAQFSKGELEYSEVRRRYNASTVKRITNAPDSVVEKFMLYYTPSYEDIKSWNDYELIKHVRKSFDYYEKNKNQKSLEELNSPSFIKPQKEPVRLTE
jgi:hypothetical protein